MFQYASGRHRFDRVASTDGKRMVFRCRKCGHTVEGNPTRHGCMGQIKDEKGQILGSK